VHRAPRGHSITVRSIEPTLNKNRPAAALMLLSLAATACQDLPTGTLPDSMAAPAAPIRSAAGAPEPAYVCYVSDRVSTLPTRYRYFRYALHFPHTAAPSGQPAVLVRFALGTPDAAPVSVANCRIPATRQAQDLLYRHLLALSHGGARAEAHRPSAAVKVAPRLPFDDRRRLLLPGSGTGPARPAGGLRDETGCGSLADPCSVGGFVVGGYVNWLTYGGGGGWGGDWGSQGDNYYSGGEGDTYDPGTPPTSSPYSQGPLLWGACILGVIGATMSIDQVSGAFKTWYDASRTLQMQKSVMQSLEANSGSVDPAFYALEEYKLLQAQQRADAAAEAVTDATNVSYLTLAAAAVTCGATFLIPTP
jgi:hypothetical protein